VPTSRLKDIFPYLYQITPASPTQFERDALRPVILSSIFGDSFLHVLAWQLMSTESCNMAAIGLGLPNNALLYFVCTLPAAAGNGIQTSSSCRSTWRTSTAAGVLAKHQQCKAQLLEQHVTVLTA
jgi:hypothetical protein